MRAWERPPEDAQRSLGGQAASTGLAGEGEGRCRQMKGNAQDT